MATNKTTQFKQNQNDPQNEVITQRDKIEQTKSLHNYKEKKIPY